MSSPDGIDTHACLRCVACLDAIAAQMTAMGKFNLKGADAVHAAAKSMMRENKGVHHEAVSKLKKKLKG